MPTISAKDEFNKDADMLLFMENEIPHPDQVYKFHAAIVEQKTFLRWDIKPDCYLYLNKFSFFDERLNTYLKASFPEGKILVDEYFGKVEVFFDAVEVILDIGKEIEKEINIHLLGVTRLEFAEEFIKHGITSFDSTSPFRQAFLDAKDNYHFKGDTYRAIKVPQ